MAVVPSEIAALAADIDFWGVIRVDTPGDPDADWTAAFGPASRRFGIENQVDTSFAIASGTKGLTALVVMSLVDQGVISLSTTVRSVLGADLPLIDDRVTVEHLLTHRSGIGDYFDEAAVTSISNYILAVPVHRLDSTESYLRVLAGHPQTGSPGERFAYCNSGYVVLALIAERVSDRQFRDLVQERVCGPAEMASTGFARGDAPPEGSAEGYMLIDGEWRTNVLHLPVLGSGDGGLYAKAAELTAFWAALFQGRIVSSAGVEIIIHPHSEVPAERRRYGMGFWLHRSSRVVMLEGYDAGISFRSVHDPVSGRTMTTLSNTADGAWPITAAVEAYYGLD